MQLRRLVLLSIALLIASGLARGQTPTEAGGERPPAQTQAEDPFHRESPRSTVFQFLRAAAEEDYELAARYLDTSQQATALKAVACDDGL